MLKTLETGTPNEIISALTAATALSDDEVVELCALWKTHEAAGVKKQAKKTLEKLAPGPCTALKSVIKASLGNDDRKITKKLAALEVAGGFPDVAGLAAALARRTEEHLGLGYLCSVGGPLARAALQAAVTDAGHLDLSFTASFPDELAEVKGVRSLELRSCGLKTLPPPVLGLEDLRVLDLSHNRFNPLPDEIRELPHLEKIVLHDVPLNKGLGQGVYDLGELRELWIIRGKMKEIPGDISRIQSLEHLRYIQCDKVKQIPDSVAELDNLKTLEVDWCALEQVNPVVWSLTGLEHLDLSQSPLEAIPAEIGAMKKLKKLRMLCETMGDLPDEICNCTELEDFDIRGRMTRLPDDIGNWKQLKRFSVSFCALLEAIPESFWTIPGLEYVDFKYTRIPKEDYERAQQTWPDAYVCT